MCQYFCSNNRCYHRSSYGTANAAISCLDYLCFETLHEETVLRLCTSEHAEEGCTAFSVAPRRRPRVRNAHQNESRPGFTSEKILLVVDHAQPRIQQSLHLLRLGDAALVRFDMLHKCTSISETRSHRNQAMDNGTVCPRDTLTAGESSKRSEFRRVLDIVGITIAGGMRHRPRRTRTRW